MSEVNRIDQLVWTAHGDAWQAEGRLRAQLGGGAAELPGIRLMASGLPHPQWNNGDVTDAALVPWDEVRAWYAARADGAGVPWGVRVPAGIPLPRGRMLFRKRCMALLPNGSRALDLPAGVRIRMATTADVDAISRVDAAAFGGSVEVTRRWIEPHLGAPGFTVVLAELEGEVAGIATAIRTEGMAGSCAGIFGVGVLESARRRGIGSALTSWLVLRAFADGATLAHLNPDTDAAERLYARLGFVATAGFDVYVEL
jgi:ribosomal protein S18 acetylase RimI-like enzyme